MHRGEKGKTIEKGSEGKIMFAIEGEEEKEGRKGLGRKRIRGRKKEDCGEREKMCV